MKFWPFKRHTRPLDRTGPATVYPNRSGALSPEAVREVQARRNPGRHWAEPRRGRHAKDPVRR